MKTIPLKGRSATLWITLILGLIFLLTVTRLVIIGIRAGKESLQGDFVAYYTAGQALNMGLSPYKNFIAHDPPVWDGVARSRYSRFLYPPLAAALFQPLAWMSYPTSKFVWELITLAFLAFSLYFTAKIFPLKSVNQYLAVGIVATLFFPVLTHIEIGQIDAITLLLITTSIVLITRNLKKEGLLAGFCLAVATLLKLHSVYFLPFILIKKRWHVLQGYLYGIIIIILTTMIFPGRDYLYDYAINQFPRISGIMAVDDSLGRAERHLIKTMLEDIPDGFTVKDGKVYRLSLFPFSTDATIIEPLTKYSLEHNLPISRSILSLSLFLLLFMISWIWQSKSSYQPVSEQQQFLTWQIPVIVTLLTAPYTWVMNVVWLLPFSVILVTLYSSAGSKQQLYALLPLTIGFMLIAANEGNVPFPSALSNLSAYKYIIGEIIMLFGLFYYLPGRNVA